MLSGPRRRNDIGSSPKQTDLPGSAGTGNEDDGFTPPPLCTKNELTRTCQAPLARREGQLTYIETVVSFQSKADRTPKQEGTKGN